MTSLDVRNFRQDLVNLINSYDIPAEVKRLVIDEVRTAVVELANTEVINDLANQKTNEICKDESDSE